MLDLTKMLFRVEKLKQRMDCLWQTVVISASPAILTHGTDISRQPLCKSQTEGCLTDYQWDRIDEAITPEARFTHFLSLAQFGIVISQQFPAASAQQRFEAVWNLCDSNGGWEQHSTDLFDPCCHCSICCWIWIHASRRVITHWDLSLRLPVLQRPFCNEMHPFLPPGLFLSQNSRSILHKAQCAVVYCEDYVPQNKAKPWPVSREKSNPMMNVMVC